MKRIHYVIVFAGVAIVLAAAGGYLLLKRRPTFPSVTNSGRSSSASAAPASQVTWQNYQNQDIANTTTNFIGTLTAGGTAESAGHERSYIVTYQVAFLRETPEKKLPEENLTYRELQERENLAPNYFFYGEVVHGIYDPAHPDVIAVHAKIGKNDMSGYVDAKKLWLEPALSPVETPRYMARNDNTAIRVVPDPASPAVLSILQGEVVEAVGQLNFRNEQWIKTRIIVEETPRYGFIQAKD